MRAKKKTTASKIIAYWILTVDTICTICCMWFCYLSIKHNYTGGLPYLTTMIGAAQAATAIVLHAYFDKSKAENTSGGIVYEAATNKNVDAI